MVAMLTRMPTARAPFKIVGSDFALGVAASDPVIGQHQDRMGQSGNRPLLAVAIGQPPLTRTELDVFRPGGRVSRLHEGGPQEALALAGLVRCPLAYAFMIAGGDTSP